ncbi:PadR family transcriptional regulator [Gordonia sp. N1V]|uniref:PadR family transcriptional regulator n=1 Tax=Gordonia sp. N1V TaxID=3034163 RepID=UPI0023E11E6C|nr:PadR family transcriptional regulator [Gordonia sp. N1V]MDF3285384.1 PadR family transcriptional regulator [Gordonia sp. N1V]
MGVVGAGRGGGEHVLAPLAVLVLGLLAEQPLHPYEMVQITLERREDRLVKFRPGTLYHTVDRLLGNGLIEVHDVRREGNRPERTVYAITEAGQEALVVNLERILAQHSPEYPELYLALSEAHALPRPRVIELLSARIEAMRADLAQFVDAAEWASGKGIPEMFFLDAGCRIVTLRTQIEWLAGLLGRLESGEIEWLDDPDSPYAAMQHMFSSLESPQKVTPQ